jgi:hypothetical protein
MRAFLNNSSVCGGGEVERAIKESDLFNCTIQGPQDDRMICSKFVEELSTLIGCGEGIA